MDKIMSKINDTSLELTSSELDLVAGGAASNEVTTAGGPGDGLGRRTTLGPMAPKKKPTAAKLRSWRVSIMCARTHYHYLGVVYAPDEKSAEAAAIAEYKIGADMRRRLIARPDD